MHCVLSGLLLFMRIVYCCWELDLGPVPIPQHWHQRRTLARPRWLSKQVLEASSGLLLTHSTDHLNHPQPLKH